MPQYFFVENVRAGPKFPCDPLVEKMRLLEELNISFWDAGKLSNPTNISTNEHNIFMVSGVSFWGADKFVSKDDYIKELSGYIDEIYHGIQGENARTISASLIGIKKDVIGMFGQVGFILEGWKSKEIFGLFLDDGYTPNSVLGSFSGINSINSQDALRESLSNNSRFNVDPKFNSPKLFLDEKFRQLNSNQAYTDYNEVLFVPDENSTIHIAGIFVETNSKGVPLIPAFIHDFMKTLSIQRNWPLVYIKNSKRSELLDEGFKLLVDEEGVRSFSFVKNKIKIAVIEYRSLDGTSRYLFEASAGERELDVFEVKELYNHFYEDIGKLTNNNDAKTFAYFPELRLASKDILDFLILSKSNSSARLRYP